jgi:AcrR family transcriptional regulator
MPARGPYAKGKARRAEILTAAVEVIAQQGYSKATVKELADAVGISQNGLLHYFGSKDALFAEILRHRDEMNAAEISVDEHDFSDELVDAILYAVTEETESPGMAQLMLRMAGEATEPDHLAHDFLRKRYQVIRAIVEKAVNQRKGRGQVAPEVDASTVASLVYASWDGLRIQWMYDKSIDVRERMTYLLRHLGLIGDAHEEPAPKH